MIPAVADSRGSSLARKLGVDEEGRLALLWAPDDVPVDVPTGVHVVRRLVRTADLVLAFFTQGAELERRLDRLGAMVFPGGGLWIAWPKRTSRMATDLTDHAVRALALPRGLVDNKVCAIDETWTGLRLVWRRELRGAPGPPERPGETS